MRPRAHLVVIPIAALLCIAPLLRYGCSCGHDLDFHLISWLDAARQISRGNLHPHWAYTPAFAAGEPRFIFYPPLSWNLGAILTLLLRTLPHLAPGRAFAAVPIVYIWITLSAAGLSMHALVRRYASPGVALFAATLYLSNPYTLFTAYERAAFGELLAAAWIPLLLLAILPASALQPRDPGSVQSDLRHVKPPGETAFPIPLLALSIALLWLTNAPAAVMSCYAAALIAILRLARAYSLSRSLRAALVPAAKFVAGVSLGLALAAFYIVPAAYERRWVEIEMATIPSFRIADNTIFHHIGDAAHDAVVHTVSLIAILLLGINAIALLCAFFLDRRRKTGSKRGLHLLGLLAIGTAAIAFLLTPPALPLWRYTPELAFLQFPWRLLAILAAFVPLTFALALRTLPLRMPAALVLALLTSTAFSYAAYPAYRQACDPNESPEEQFASFLSASSTEPTDEYTPVTADNDSLHAGNPPFVLTPAPSTSSPSLSHVAGPAPSQIDLDLRAPGQIVLNLRDYPAWLITRNGLPVTERLERPDGLIAFTVPAGHSRIGITFRTTGDRRIGSAISVVALCLFAPLSYAASRRRNQGASRNTHDTR